MKFRFYSFFGLVLLLYPVPNPLKYSHHHRPAKPFLEPTKPTNATNATNATNQPTQAHQLIKHHLFQQLAGLGVAGYLFVSVCLLRPNGGEHLPLLQVVDSGRGGGSLCPCFDGTGATAA
jgi:hypothetical protein